MKIRSEFISKETKTKLIRKKKQC